MPYLPSKSKVNTIHEPPLPHRNAVCHQCALGVSRDSQAPTPGTGIAKCVSLIKHQPSLLDTGPVHRDRPRPRSCGIVLRARVLARRSVPAYL